VRPSSPSAPRRFASAAQATRKIASLALHLASPEATFVNGAAFVIDGGATAR
jgi:NAD(P)-dependent dehydrogenase (short-subunit alcohol dehydrogenase family)